MSVCKACDQPLVIELEHDEDEQQQAGGSSSAAASNTQPDTVPDDVELSCGCHFHWYVNLNSVLLYFGYSANFFWSMM